MWTVAVIESGVKHHSINKSGKGFEGTEMGIKKSSLLLYVDNIASFSESKEGLQNGLCIVEEYCDIGKIKVHIQRTKVMI